MEHNVNQAILKFLLSKLSIPSCKDRVKKILTQEVVKIHKQFLLKWCQCRYSETNFRHKYKIWLNKSINLEHVLKNIRDNRPLSPQPSSSLKSQHLKRFADCTPETKRRRIESLLQYSSEELAYATQLKLFSEGRRKAASIVKKLRECPDEVDAFRRLSLSTNEPVKMTPVEALTFLVQNRLSKFQYIQIRKKIKNHNADIFPNYNFLVNAKKECYPPNIFVCESRAEVPLQNVVDLTLQRQLTVQREVVHHISEQCNSKNIELTAIYKWGCDGAAGFNSYKQKFLSEKFDDSFLFEISFVPLEIHQKNTKNILWKNLKPSSVLNCRPIAIIFRKESADLVKKEVTKIEKQISDLKSTKLNIDGIECTIDHSFYMTMIDGKICGYVTGTSSANCYLCGAKPSQMTENRPMKPELLSKFGMSSLHAWIKCLECILHISYRLDIQRWQIRKDNENQVKIRKDKIKENLQTELGLKVDTVKQGFGTYNDGNSARRFFEAYDISARITGVDVELIRRLNTILRTISCNFKINVEKFKQYCYDTAKIYNEKYQWYYMPVTLHKLLYHGADIIQSSVLPIGQLSEEALESRHKDSKRFRYVCC